MYLSGMSLCLIGALNIARLAPFTRDARLTNKKNFCIQDKHGDRHCMLQSFVRSKIQCAALEARAVYELYNNGYSFVTCEERLERVVDISEKRYKETKEDLDVARLTNLHLNRELQKLEYVMETQKRIHRSNVLITKDELLKVEKERDFCLGKKEVLRSMLVTKEKTLSSLEESLKNCTEENERLQKEAFSISSDARESLDNCVGNLEELNEKLRISSLETKYFENKTIDLKLSIEKYVDSMVNNSEEFKKRERLNNASHWAELKFCQQQVRYDYLHLKNITFTYTSLLDQAVERELSLNKTLREMQMEMQISKSSYKNMQNDCVIQRMETDHLKELLEDRGNEIRILKNMLHSRTSDNRGRTVRSAGTRDEESKEEVVCDTSPFLAGIILLENLFFVGWLIIAVCQKKRKKYLSSVNSTPEQNEQMLT